MCTAMNVLNVRVPTVRDHDPETDKYIVSPDETLAAREKLCRIYNDLIDATRTRQFGGAHLKLPGPRW